MVRRKFRAVWREVRRLGHLARRYRNWPALWMAKYGGTSPITIKLRHGPTFIGADANISFVVAEVYENRVYGPPPKGRVLDIGANVGVFSVYAAASASEVECFEPFPQNVELARANLERNGITNVEIHAAAVSNHSDGADLFISNIAAGHLLFDHNIHGDLKDKVRVPTVSLADFLDRPADFVKIDCEGSEGVILSSLRPENFANIAQLAIEYHDNVSSLDHNQIAALLELNGFVVEVVGDDSPFGYIYAHR